MNTGMMLVQMMNSITLFLDMAIAYLVGRDARKKRLPWSSTIMWVLISLLFFPIGTGLYFWLGRPRLQKAKEA
ncbi:MAG: hypothetical protein PVJ61_06760 [Dehalococcoidia bacterium]|jgi:hypothetical protein